MRAVVPDEWIEERRRLGLDRRDEMWDGVLHMVPPASSSHSELGSDLAGILVDADDDGCTALESLGLALRTAGGRLQVRTDTGIEEV